MWDCRGKVTSGGLKQFSGVTEQENAMADEKQFNLCLYMWDSNSTNKHTATGLNFMCTGYDTFCFRYVFVIDLIGKV